ncbi:MAG: tRNA pseudouridine(38-40) synthase TruA [Bacillota bacterium]|nr:tRNA pseudouridine(38-40) synthase TruA [Bacillota bacterium]
MDRNILLTIAYDGSSFHGWQRQPNQRTVQGHLETVMSGLFKREILLSGTSRTDAGVHALDQKATFRTDIAIPIEKLPQVINNALCAREGRETGRGAFAKAPISIISAEEMPSDFHPRFDSKGKKYIYRIKDDSFCTEKNGVEPLPLVFERNYVYNVRGFLDVEAMNEAASYLVGTQDFKSFEASGGNPRETTVRTIYEAEVVSDGSTSELSGLMNSSIELRVRGDGFLYNMVRIITGTLVEIGTGKLKPEDMKTIIEATDRTKAGHTAPPNGLYLARVYY